MKVHKVVSDATLKKARVLSKGKGKPSAPGARKAKKPENLFKKLVSQKSIVITVAHQNPETLPDENYIVTYKASKTFSTTTKFPTFLDKLNMFLFENGMRLEKILPTI